MSLKSLWTRKCCYQQGFQNGMSCSWELSKQLLFTHFLFFIKLILYKTALEPCGLHFAIKKWKKKKKEGINLETF